jgi:hypothetical protein
MNIVVLGRYALNVSASLFLLAGCGGFAQLAPSALPQSVTTSTAAARSWMLPEAATASSLLYVSNSGNGTVTVYSYQAGADLKLVGSLAIPQPSGVCSDKDGNVWIGSQHIPHLLHEFPHGGTKQIRLIRVGGGFPAGCAVDRTSGNLAVALNHPHTKFLGHYGYVDVFTPGSAYPTKYVFGRGFYSVAFPAYDDKGNLFVDGAICTNPSYCYAPPSRPPGLFEVRKGASAFSQLDLKGVVFNAPTGLAWIKPTLLVAESDYENTGTSVGYKMFVSGSTATLVQTVPFGKVAQANGVSVRAGVAIVADIAGQAVRTYLLSDGTQVAALFKGLSAPYAVAVSQKP